MAFLLCIYQFLSSTMANTTTEDKSTTSTAPDVPREISELDWISLRQDLGTAHMEQVESPSEKFKRKSKENPFVPIGELMCVRERERTCVCDVIFLCLFFLLSVNLDLTFILTIFTRCVKTYRKK